MHFFSGAFYPLVAFACMAVYAVAHEDGDVAVRVDIIPGPVRNGAKCTGKDKHLIMKSIGTVLQTQSQDGAEEKHNHDPEWCDALCLPATDGFCKVFNSRCIEKEDAKGKKRGFDRMLLEDTEILSKDMFFDDGSPGRMLRGLEASPVKHSAEQEMACTAAKKRVFNSIRDDIHSFLSDECKMMMQQKFTLDCFVVGEYY